MELSANVAQRCGTTASAALSDEGGGGGGGGEHSEISGDEVHVLRSSCFNQKSCASNATAMSTVHLARETVVTSKA